MREVVILSSARTPMGSFSGALKGVHAARLGAAAIGGALERAGVQPDQVDEVIMGAVLTAGMGQAPARQAAIYAGLPHGVPCLTVNKVCGSGLKATMLAAQAIQLGDADIVVAGGMENMSQVPYALPKARDGYRMGDGKLVDLLIHDGLWDVYNDFHMGKAGELCAREMEISREEQDSFAAESYRRALNAQAEGMFEREIVPVEIPQRKGDPVVVSADEEPGRGRIDKFPKLRPVFDREGTITAANASTINDGAAAVVLASAEAASRLGLKPIARFVAHSTHAQAPEWFSTAPAKAIEKVLARANWSPEEVDLFEINEAFSVVALAAMKELSLDHAKVNVRGGAVALGHPIGASGARLLCTLLHALEDRNENRGLVTLCIGGGEAAAVVVERMGEGE
jgi:acetyl-CoA C-acetyltransferase